jgi:hypothetical protein
MERVRDRRRQQSEGRDMDRTKGEGELMGTVNWSGLILDIGRERERQREREREKERKRRRRRKNEGRQK